MQHMKSQDPDMYKDGCDVITYLFVFGCMRKASSFLKATSQQFSNEAEGV